MLERITMEVCLHPVIDLPMPCPTASKADCVIVLTNPAMYDWRSRSVDQNGMFVPNFWVAWAEG